MGSSEHGDGQVLPFSISALWVSGAPGFDQHQVEGAPSVRQRRLAVREPLFQWSRRQRSGSPTATYLAIAERT